MVREVLVLVLVLVVVGGRSIRRVAGVGVVGEEVDIRYRINKISRTLI